MKIVMCLIIQAVQNNFPQLSTTRNLLKVFTIRLYLQNLHKGNIIKYIYYISRVIISIQILNYGFQTASAICEDINLSLKSWIAE